MTRLYKPTKKVSHTQIKPGEVYEATRRDATSEGGSMKWQQVREDLRKSMEGEIEDEKEEMSPRARGQSCSFLQVAEVASDRE